MYNINPNLPLWNRKFTNFLTCLIAIERELYGKRESTYAEAEHLWNQLCDAEYIFMGMTNAGPLYLCMDHSYTGTYYYYDLKIN
jgi:hypothetical protein